MNPIRIKFVTTALEERRGESDLMDEQIDFLMNTVRFLLFLALHDVV